MNFKVKLSVFVFMAFFAFSLGAQTTPATTEKIELSTEKEDTDLAKSLNLDKSQSEQFKKINKEYKAKAQATKKAKREDLQKMREERIAAHKALLTEDQARKYDEVIANRKAKHEAKKAEKKATKKATKQKAKSKAPSGQE